MRRAFAANRGFHLWWHPHNFGQATSNNLAMLDGILRDFKRLQELHDDPSQTMAEYATASASVCRTTTPLAA